MTETDWLKKWNDRYSASEYAFGQEPNAYLKVQIEKLPTGKAIFAAEGEGRNAVFAASLGWQVSAFDISSEGRKKALQLAEKKGVSLDYRVGKLAELEFSPQSFDLVGLIYAHFGPTKSKYHKQLDELLRPGGIVIFEAFSKSHIEYRKRNENVGGPRDLDTLYSVEEIKADFANYDVIELAEVEVELNEGSGHNGVGSVVRFVGRKK